MMAEDPYLPRARSLFGSTPNPVSDRAGNVNDFRSEVERRLRPVQRMMGQSIPGQQDLGIPDYNEYTQRRVAQQSLLDRARRLFGMEPSASRAGSVPPAGTPPAPPAAPRSGGSVPEVRPAVPGRSIPALMPRAAGIGAAIPLLQQLYLATQEHRNDPPMYDAQGRYLGRMSEMYGEVAREGASGPGSVAAEAERSAGQLGGESGQTLADRGRDTGQDYSMRRPPARTGGAARPATTDPRFAAMLARILAETPATPSQMTPAPVAAAPAPSRFALPLTREQLGEEAGSGGR